MKIEIVEFYPHAKGRFVGTLHMYLIEEEMDLRGVQIFKNKDNYFIQVPSFTGPDGVRYGCVAFTDQKKQSNFMKELVRTGVKYMRDIDKKKEPSS